MKEPITEDQLKQILTETLNDYFVQIGLNVEQPFEVQKDLAYLRKVRTGSEALTSKAILTIVSAMVLAAVGAFTAGFLQWVNNAGS